MAHDPRVRVFNVRLSHPDEDLGFDYIQQDDRVGHEEGFVRIIKVTPGMPCHRAGVCNGILKRISHIPIRYVEDLATAVRVLGEANVTECEVAVLPDAALHRGVQRRRSRQQHPQRGGGRGLSGAEAATAAEEEALALRLQRLATLCRQRLLPEESYLNSKREILQQLTQGVSHGDAAPPAAPAGFVPPAPYAKINLARYVYLRSAARKNADWVGGDGVTGIVRVLRVEGAFALVRCGRSRESGYLQLKYLDYLPKTWRPGQPLPGRPDAPPPRRVLGDWLADEGPLETSWPPAGADGSAFGTAAVRACSVGPPSVYPPYPSHPCRSAGPTSSYYQHASTAPPVDFAALRSAVADATASPWSPSTPAAGLEGDWLSGYGDGPAVDIGSNGF
eukprot:TRINITY_DN20072_c0_g1_i1.p1 TRINITY_DN20072_c0_g1~~TRINITY_DN20072_c0_g1_i1.p1  ORF type:complete len:391 (+),score=82.21 TRINITY_DN20072_c0_g1_i1:122-1294(+)